MRNPPASLGKHSRPDDQDTLDAAIENKAASLEQVQLDPTLLDECPKLLHRKRQQSVSCQPLEVSLDLQAGTRILSMCRYGSPEHSIDLLEWKTAGFERRNKRAMQNLGRFVPKFSHNLYKSSRKFWTGLKPYRVLRTLRFELARGSHVKKDTLMV